MINYIIKFLFNSVHGTLINKTRYDWLYTIVYKGMQMYSKVCKKQKYAKVSKKYAKVCNFLTGLGILEEKAESHS